MTVPRISYVLETCIYGRNLAEMERFYGQVLGLEKMGEEYPRHVFFRVSPQSMLLIFNPDETQKAQDVPSHGAQGPGHLALAIDTRDLAAWRDALVGRGVEIEKEITWPNDARSLYFRDPAGNSVELVTSEIWDGPNQA